MSQPTTAGEVRIIDRIIDPYGFDITDRIIAEYGSIEAWQEYSAKVRALLNDGLAAALD